MAQKISKSIKAKAKERIVIENITLDGAKGKTNGYINYITPNLTVKNVTIANGATMYNVFEGPQTPAATDTLQKKVIMENVICDNVDLKHNVLNVYTPNNLATIIIRNCTFNLNVSNSNILRMANYANAKNVTIKFENCEWNYENSPETTPTDDWTWAGLMLFQPAAKDKALTGDTSCINTWKISFKNCKYNGTAVTANNFGEHNQCVIAYNIGGTGAVADGADIFNITFE